MRSPAFQSRNDVLVAIMNNKKDFATLHNEHWYRIPVKSAPKNIKNQTAKTIAFYQTATFKDDKWRIEWYGQIKRQTVVTRQELFPDEPLQSEKSDKIYYKIEIEDLKQLDKPIPCRLPRAITFIETTEHKFFNATEINHLFNESPLEDKFFDKLTEKRIPNERQWELRFNKKYRRLDFAVFCKVHNIALECDGDTYHDTPDQVHKDKHNDNELKSIGWSVMRFTSAAINERLEESMKLLSLAINKQGGLKIVKEETPKFVRTNNQLGLFDL
jgi:very-short-patch-repair endonuclease